MDAIMMNLKSLSGCWIYVGELPLYVYTRWALSDCVGNHSQQRLPYRGQSVVGGGHWRLVEQPQVWQTTCCQHGQPAACTLSNSTTFLMGRPMRVRKTCYIWPTGAKFSPKTLFPDAPLGPSNGPFMSWSPAMSRPPAHT